MYKIRNLCNLDYEGKKMITIFDANLHFEINEILNIINIPVYWREAFNNIVSSNLSIAMSGSRGIPPQKTTKKKSKETGIELQIMEGIPSEREYSDFSPFLRHSFFNYNLNRPYLEGYTLKGVLVLEEIVGHQVENFIFEKKKMSGGKWELKMSGFTGIMNRNSRTPYSTKIISDAPLDDVLIARDEHWHLAIPRSPFIHFFVFEKIQESQNAGPSSQVSV